MNKTFILYRGDRLNAQEQIVVDFEADFYASIGMLQGVPLVDY